MEERGNKTIMCSVLFLDIVEYSKKSVTGQISLKDRFNSYISAAISNVPLADRIILDTGDGAAINFLGDVEDALKAALGLRESMLNEPPDLDPPLLVRAGINLGPVRLVRDINGQPNIVGDGINVAQRIMGFAEAGQILVSRSYYDAVSRLSPQYAGMFRYQGSRTDKHVREHEVYVIGYPGDKAAGSAAEGAEQAAYVAMLARIRLAWQSAAARLGAIAAGLIGRFRQADPRQRALYVAAAVMPMLLVGALALKLSYRQEVSPAAGQAQAASAAQAAAVAPVAPSAEPKATEAGRTHPAAAPKPDAKKVVEGKPAAKKADEARPDAKKAGDQARQVAVPHKGKAAEPAAKSLFGGVIGGGEEQPAADARIIVTCDPGTQVFVDGAQKGKIVSGMLSIDVVPGKHAVIVNSAKGEIHTQNVELESRKAVNIRPKFCNY